MLIVYVGPLKGVSAEGLEFTKGEPVLVSNQTGKFLLNSPLFEKYSPEDTPAAPAATETPVDTVTAEETDKPFSFLNRKNP